MYCTLFQITTSINAKSKKYIRTCFRNVKKEKCNHLGDLINICRFVIRTVNL